MDRKEIVERALSRIDDDVLKSLSPKQIAEIRKAIDFGIPSSSNKLVHINVTIPFIFARYYVAVIVGRDRRVKRIAPIAEKRSHGLLWFLRRRKSVQETRPEDVVARPVGRQRWTPPWMRIMWLAALRNPAIQKTATAVRFVFDLVAVVFILTCLSVVALGFLTFVLYSVKSTLGIDLFPSRHFSEVVQTMLR